MSWLEEGWDQVLMRQMLEEAGCQPVEVGSLLVEDWQWGVMVSWLEEDWQQVEEGRQDCPEAGQPRWGCFRSRASTART